MAPSAMEIETNSGGVSGKFEDKIGSRDYQLMDGWMDGWVGGWMDGWMDGWVGGWVDFHHPSLHLYTKKTIYTSITIA